MLKETPKDDPRERTDWGSDAQTDKPWKGNPEKEQRSGTKNPIRIFGKKPARTEGATDMGLAAYDIVRSGGGWTICHDGNEENLFETKEAFEAAVGSATIALRQGNEVRITAPPRDATGDAAT
jgi:hypothetical protein